MPDRSIALTVDVEQPARRRDDDVDATAHGVDLRVDADAAEHASDERQELAVGRALSSTWPRVRASRQISSTATRLPRWPVGRRLSS